MSRKIIRLIAIGFAFIPGCSDPEPIRTVKVPKSSAGSAAASGTAAYRILGACFPADDPVWFFKLAGKADDLATVEPAFDLFVKSIRYPNGLGNSPLWDLPNGWTETPGNQMRFATIQIPDSPLQITVVKASGGAAANVARWAGQVGSQAKLEESAKAIATSANVAGLRVDLQGPKNPAGSMPGMMPPGR